VSQYEPAIKLRDIRRFCSPRPLDEGELAAFFVETEAARDPNCDVRNCIKSTLDDAASPRHILVYGHRGCGKSTELVRLAGELGGGWLCVKFSVLEELPLIGVHAEEVLLSITHQLIEAARREKLQSMEQDERLKKVGDWFKEVTITKDAGRDTQLELGAGAEASPGNWLLGLGNMFAKFSGEMKFRSSTQTSIVEAVRKRPADLIEQINRLIESVQAALRPLERRLLIIVEDLDKLGIADARRVFIENNNLLTGLRANIIYTIPIFTFYSPDADAMNAAFDAEYSLPMIKVSNPDGSRATKGFEVVKEIVHRRVAKTAIEEAALDLLITKTGGVLRHVFEVLQTASSMTTLREPPIQKQHIEYALGRLKTNLGLQIALPHQKIDGVDNVEQLFDKLVEYARLRTDPKKCSPTSEPIVQVLLQSCALVEYNGTRWLGVHPLVLELLKDLGKEV
jgi:hypothetical protein